MSLGQFVKYRPKMEAAARAIAAAILY
jgi:hypothetical protein